MSENTVNNALRLMGYDTKVDVCGHGFRAMACISLIKSDHDPGMLLNVR